MSRSSLTERPYDKLVELGDALDAVLSHAKKTLPRDRFIALSGTSQKLMTTLERASVQLGYLLHQYERLSTPPRGPAEVHRLSQYSKRRKKRPS